MSSQSNDPDRDAQIDAAGPVPTACRKKRKSRRWFTRDNIVSVAILLFVSLVLVALLSPVDIFSVGGREPARRAQCINNFKQLSRAIVVHWAIRPHQVVPC